MLELFWKTARKVPLGGEDDFSTRSTIIKLVPLCMAMHDNNGIRLSSLEKGQVGQNKRARRGLIIPLPRSLLARKMKNGTEC